MSKLMMILVTNWVQRHQISSYLLFPPPPPPLPSLHLLTGSQQICLLPTILAVDGPCLHTTQTSCLANSGKHLGSLGDSPSLSSHDRVKKGGKKRKKKRNWVHQREQERQSW